MQRILLISATLLASWLGMQAIHELGHILAAWLTGGEVARVVLHPLTISRTDLANNPQPLPVVWAGPVCAASCYRLGWGLAVFLKLPGAFVARFFAGFCLIANGLYIGLGSAAAIGDCGEMLRHGSSIWQLCLFGAVTVPAGFWLWNGQGRHFGLGSEPETISPRVVYAVLTAAVILILIGLLTESPF